MKLELLSKKPWLTMTNSFIAKTFGATLVTLVVLAGCDAYSVLLATMGGTKSHTVPFIALGTALTARGHNVTLVSGFPGTGTNNGLKELVPTLLEVSRLKKISNRNLPMFNFLMQEDFEQFSSFGQLVKISFTFKTFCINCFSENW